MELKHLKDKPIAVLGAGGVGKPMAGDIALAGGTVRIWDQEDFAGSTLNNIDRGIDIEGAQLSYFNFRRSGRGFVEFASTDMAKIVKDTGIICITTVAQAHEKVFTELIPLLEDDQIIHLIPDNYGTLLLRKMMREAGCTKRVIIGGWCTSPYGARVQIKGGITTNRVNVVDRVTILRGAALPDTDTEVFLESGNYIPAFEAILTGHGLVAADTVLDTNFSNTNPVIHVPGTVLGAAVMQNFESVLGKKLEDYSMYAHALCPAVAEVQAEFWEEEKRIAASLGVGICRVDYDEFFSRSSMYGHEYMGPDYCMPFEMNYITKYGDGPFSLENRYITEDVPVGCYVYQQLARRNKIMTPTIDSLVHLANIMIKRDLIAQSSYTLDYLGIGHLSDEQLHMWLREGKYSEKR